MRHLLLALTLLMLAAAPIAAQPSEQQLLEAYRNQDMTVWQAYIDASDWTELTEAEQLRLLRYEYGFAAAMLELDKQHAKAYTQQFGEHINQARPILTEALYNVYMSAYHTYCLALTKNVFAHGKAIFDHAQAALDADSTEPMSWVMQANIHFFAPRLMGGDKRKALEEYDRADSLMMLRPEIYTTRWELYEERRNRQLCEDKLKKKNINK